jgi:hypothetical protein
MHIRKIKYRVMHVHSALSTLHFNKKHIQRKYNISIHIINKTLSDPEKYKKIWIIEKL